MLSIGEFSKMCGVSTKTLRYYDEIGLIKPEVINPENAYRYYSVRQMKRMLFINRLKSYHFSLEEMKGLLKMEEDSFEEVIRSALHRKRLEIQDKLHAYEHTLLQMNADILSLEKGVPLMSYLNDIDVQLVDTPPMNILSIRQKISGEEYNAGYGPFLGRLFKRITTDKLTMLGTPMTIYHSPEYDPSGNDTEFAIPIQEFVKGTRDLPGGLCAKSILKGTYSGLTSVFARLTEWIEQEGYVLVRSPYEVYLSDPDHIAAPDDLVTEVYFPVKKR
ncbi:MerR family transcriptional regulator [Paenibacillus sp. YPG26]|uniref:MerR family transcriptional regulator n=1 Tax=Paenibacillus sp. YPG26 TaxID=2878915 RepID=UPI00203C8AF1|nr:MerR family transcriptional regulator [Paenibacillus sp. YPG26]USB31676.1 MerR family transcriptional regulator [Paenibacillus sp. YPG26]